MEDIEKFANPQNTESFSFFKSQCNHDISKFNRNPAGYARMDSKGEFQP